MLKRIVGSLARRVIGEAWIDETFQTRLINQTNNFSNVNWLGFPVWQDVLSLWTLQETIVEVRPELIIECGTNRGGSAMFYAHLFDLLGGGRIVTIDIEKLHDHTHQRVTWLVGSSTSTEILDEVKSHVAQCTGPIMVILDSDHSKDHVLAELNAYHGFVTPGSYLIVQDGVIDTLPMFAGGRPGPLAAIRQFMQANSDFVIEHDKSQRFLITHHPSGWLKRL